MCITKKATNRNHPYRYLSVRLQYNLMLNRLILRDIMNLWTEIILESTALSSFLNALSLNILWSEIDGMRTHDRIKLTSLTTSSLVVLCKDSLLRRTFLGQFNYDLVHYYMNTSDHQWHPHLLSTSYCMSTKKYSVVKCSEWFSKMTKY